MTMKLIGVVVLVAGLAGAQERAGWTLVWSDEFDRTGRDARHEQMDV